MHDLFHSALQLLDAGDARGLQQLLGKHPELVRHRADWDGPAYFRHPSLLEFVAENPTRNDKLPENIVEMARIVLDADAKSDAAAVNRTLMLVATGRVARECGAQEPLIDLLASYGGDVNGAMLPALAHGEFAAAKALLIRGANLSLPVAAALGRSSFAAELLPDATAEERHCALALAAQFGHAELEAPRRRCLNPTEPRLPWRPL